MEIINTIINRVKAILVSPQTEWPIIEAENAPHVKLCTNYLALLALIPAIAAFIGYGIIGFRVPILGMHVSSIEIGVRQAIMLYIQMVGGAYLTAFIIDLLAPNFGAQKDLNRTFSLVAYAYTPMLLGGIFFIFPKLSWLAFFAGLYGLYLLYIGLQPMMKVPTEKQPSYFVVSLLVMLGVAVLLGVILGAILLPKGMYLW